MTSIETPSPPPGGKDNRRHHLPTHDEDLDDDDDNGSKAGDGDYEDVRCFDAESDLQPGEKVVVAAASPQLPQVLQQHFHLPAAAPIVVVAPPVHSSVGVSTSAAVGGMAPMFLNHHQGGSSTVLDFGGQDANELSLVSRIVSIPWPAAAGKRPPRDMKRLDINQWYVVCKVMKWGDTPALFMRVCNAADAETDFGFYKPPVLFHTYPFQVGDRLQLHMVGYSMSRNKIATSIRLRTTHMFPLIEGKLDWVVPPTPKSEPSSSAETSTTASKKKSNSASSNNSGSTHSSPRAPQASLHHAQQQQSQMNEDLANKRKRLAIQLPVPQGLPQQQQQTSPMHIVGGQAGNNNSSLNFFHSSMGFPLASTAQQQQQPQQQQQMTHNNSLMYFPSNGSFSSNSSNVNGNSSQQPNAPSYTVTASGFHMPGTPDMNRAPSFSFMNDLMASNPSTVNLIPPPSPNIMNSSAPSLMRIPPVSSSFPMSGSTPSANCPPSFSSSFGFGSTSNMTSFLAQQQQQQSTTPSMPSASLQPLSGGNGHLNTNGLGE